MITYLSIQHYRSVGSVDLCLGNVNVLVGPNGAGKSNLLDAIAFIRDSLRYGLDQAVTDRQGIQTIRQWSPTRPYNITMTIRIRNSDTDFGEFSFTLTSRGTSFAIRRETGSWRESIRLRFRDRRTTSGYKIKYYDTYHTYVRGEYGKITVTDMDDGSTTTEKIEEIDDFYLGSRHARPFFSLRRALLNFEIYTIFPNTLRQPEKQSGEEYLKSHGDNLASILRRMRRKKRHEAINEIVLSLQSVLPALDNISVQSIAGLLTPLFLVKDSRGGKSHYFHVNQMSDGTLRILGLLVALYQNPRPATLALEEPELTVHPGVLQLIAEAIHEVSESSQIIITTHSPDFIDYFQPEDIIAVELIDGNTSARHIRKSQLNAVKDDLMTLGELMSIEGIHGEG